MQDRRARLPAPGPARGPAPGPVPEAPGDDAGRPVTTLAAPSVRPSSGARSSSSSCSWSGLVVGVLVALSAVAGAAAGAHPTGTWAVDPVYGAAFAGLTTWAASRAGRESWLAVAAVGVVMSRGWLLLPAAVALAVAFASVFDRRSRRRTGAVVGALAGQVVLRWPPIGFHGATALVAGLAVVPVVVSAYRRAPRPGRRTVRRVAAAVGGVALLLCLPFLVAGLLVEPRIAQGTHEAQRALDAVSAGEATTATADLGAARRDFAGADGAVNGWWNAGAALVPVVAQQRRAVAAATDAAATLTAVGARTAGRLDYHQLGYHDGRIDLSMLPPMAAPAATLDRAIAAAQARIGATGSPWLLPPVGNRRAQLVAQLGRARTTTDIAVQAIGVLPAMLGAAGERHYLVVFTTPSEARGLGGFIGAYGELTADDGRLSLRTSGSIQSLRTAGIPPTERTLTGPPDFLAQYGTFHPEQFFEDSTFSPDFPTDADVVSQLYPQAGGTPLDGVMAIDPYALAALLRITGPVSVPGLPVPLTSANAAQVLLRDQYTLYDSGQAPDNQARHDLLQDALHVAFDRIVQGSLPAPRTLAQDLVSPVRDGRLYFWSAHPDEEPLFERLGADGTFPRPGDGDLLAVTVQDAEANKIDAFLHQRISDQVAYDPATGSAHEVVTVALRNDAPASGLPAYVIAPADAPPGTPEGANYAMVTLYSPLAFDQVSVDGVPSTLAAGVELGSFAYRTWVTIPPGTTLTMQVTLTGTLPAGTTLPFHVRVQPSANPVSLTLTMAPGAGWQVVGSPTWTAGSAAVELHRFRFSPS